MDLKKILLPKKIQRVSKGDSVVVNDVSQYSVEYLKNVITPFVAEVCELEIGGAITVKSSDNKNFKVHSHQFVTKNEVHNWYNLLDTKVEENKFTARSLVIKEINNLFGVIFMDIVVVPIIHKTKEDAISEWEYFERANTNELKPFLGHKLTHEEIDSYIDEVRGQSWF